MSTSVYYVRSSTDPDRFYVVAENSRGFYECDCKAAQFNRTRPCKHAEQVRRGCGLVARPKDITPGPSPAMRDTADLFGDNGAAIERSLAAKREADRISDAAYASDPDCPVCGWGAIGCRYERTGCAARTKAVAR